MMMKVVSQKMITSYPPELSAGGAKRDACRLWPSVHDGDVVVDI